MRYASYPDCILFFLTWVTGKEEKNRLVSVGVAVEGKLVDGARGNARDDARVGGAGNVGAEGSGGLLAEEGEEVGAKTGDVGGGHGSARDGVLGSGGADPGRGDGSARGKDVDDGAVVGVVGNGISRGGGADSADGGLGSGRVVGGVGTVVAGGDSEEDTGPDHGGSGAVGGGRVAAAEGHVGDGAVGAVAALRVLGNKVHAGNDTRVAAGAVGVEHLDGVELRLLGHTIRGSSNRTRHVRAVTISVRVNAIAGVVGEPGSAATKVAVGGVDTGVDDVGAGSGAGGAVVDVGGLARGLGGKTGETPRGDGGLGGVGVDGEDGLLLDVLDLVGVRDADWLANTRQRRTEEGLPQGGSGCHRGSCHRCGRRSHGRRACRRGRPCCCRASSRPCRGRRRKRSRGT